MPLVHLRLGCWYYLGYCSDMRTEVVGNVSPPKLRRHASGKVLRWLELPAAHVLIRPRSSPGSSGGYNAGASVAYENQAKE